MGSALRLADNPLLTRAIQTEQPLLLLAQAPSNPLATVVPAAAEQLRLHLQALAGFRAAVRKRGGDVLVLPPPWTEHLSCIATAFGHPQSIYVPEAIGAQACKDATRARNWARNARVPLHTRWCGTLVDVEDLPYLPEYHDDDFDAYRVKTARFHLVHRPLAEPGSLAQAYFAPEDVPTQLAQAQLIPQDSVADLPAIDSAAFSCLDTRPPSLKHHAEPNPANVGLAMGTLSARQLYHQYESQSRASNPTPRTQPEALYHSLLLRDHYRLMAHKHAEVLEDPGGVLRMPIRWNHAPHWLEAWQQGQTGVPIVDAAMRHLAHSGTLPHRLRLLVASFLVRHLGIDWTQGARWFEATLHGHDPASNTFNWMQVAGVLSRKRFGFQYLDPVAQALRHDPHGEYVRHWCPELARIGPKWIHTPWLIDPEKLRAKGVILGATYPSCICGELTAAVEQAHLAYKRAAHEAGLRYGRPLIRKFVSTPRDRTRRGGIQLK